MRLTLVMTVLAAVVAAQSASGFANALVRNIPVENGGFEDFEGVAPAAWRVHYGPVVPVEHEDEGVLAARLTPDARGDSLLQQYPVISEPIVFVPGSPLVLAFEHHLAGPPDALGYAEICWVTDAGIGSTQVFLGPNLDYAEALVVGYPGGTTVQAFIINFILLAPDGADMGLYSWSVDNVHVRMVALP